MPAVARINGGWFDDERTRDLAKTVIYLSLATATVYIVDTAVEVADPFTRNRFDEEYYYNLTGTEVVYVAGAAAFYTSVAVGLLCVLLIPICGCVGAKTKDLNLIKTFCCFSGVCTCCTFCNVLTLLLWASFGNTAIRTCEDIRSYGYNPAYCYTQVGLSVILFILYTLNTCFSWQLVQACEVIVIQTTRPQYTTYATTSQPTTTFDSGNSAQEIPVATPVTTKPFATATAIPVALEQEPYSQDKSTTLNVV